MRRVRDSQRTKVYAAEHHSGLSAMPINRKFSSLHEANSYALKLINSNWAKRQGIGGQMIVLRDGRGKRNAQFRSWGHQWVIDLPHCHRDVFSLLHEIAHGMAPTGPAHGPKFCKSLLALVERWMGMDARIRLREAFKTHGVKYITRINPEPFQAPKTVPVIRKPDSILIELNEAIDLLNDSQRPPWKINRALSKIMSVRQSYQSFKKGGQT